MNAGLQSSKSKLFPLIPPGWWHRRQGKTLVKRRGRTPASSGPNLKINQRDFYHGKSGYATKSKLVVQGQGDSFWRGAIWAKIWRRRRDSWHRKIQSQRPREVKWFVQGHTDSLCLRSVSPVLQQTPSEKVIHSPASGSGMTLEHRSESFPSKCCRYQKWPSLINKWTWWCSNKTLFTKLTTHPALEHSNE